MMNGTFYSNGGFRWITRLIWPVRWRTAGFALVLLLGASLIAWTVHRTSSQLGRLQQEFITIQAESFYLGVRLRGGLEQLNSALLRFQLSKAEPAERDRFYEQARSLEELITRTEPFLTTPQESQLVGEILLAYNAYLTNAAPLLEKGVRAVRRDSATLVDEQIQEISAPLLGLCERLVQLQKASWKSFLDESQAVLGSFRTASQISMLLLVALALLLAVLGYRLSVDPLRQELSQTRIVLERQEKLASLGTLAAGVAHEIRNPLAALKFRLFSLRKSLPGEVANNEDVMVIGEEINRLERIIKDFLQFARPSEPALVRITAQQVLQTVSDLLQAQLQARGIRLHVESSEAVWLRADKQQIEQVLINLVQNAADSIAGSGTIVLRVKQGAARLEGRSTPAVMLEVEDTGHGIPAEVQQRLFDPFYSTKAGGTGLGLPIAERIVEKHGGLLQYQTQPKRGTTFQVVLPVGDHHDSKDSNHRR